jgi:magnesium chelatase family protein
MDRIDLYADVEEIDHERLLGHSENSSDEEVRKRVLAARNLQAIRYSSPTKLNAEMSNHDIRTNSLLSQEAQKILNQAATSLELSARSYMRIIKVARSIADLENSTTIEPTHVSEALQYRGQNLQAVL